MLRDVSGVQRVDERVLAAMEAYDRRGPGPQSALRRGHAVAGRRNCRRSRWWPRSRPAFTRSIAPAERLYAMPLEWAEKHGIQRWGFHGASHRYIADRTAQLLGKPDAKIISCHLGGSSSLCAIEDGKSRGHDAWA